jgi:hypothetical protein
VCNCDCREEVDMNGCTPGVVALVLSIINSIALFLV